MDISKNHVTCSLAKRNHLKLASKWLRSAYPGNLQKVFRDALIGHFHQATLQYL